MFNAAPVMKSTSFRRVFIVYGVGFGLLGSTGLGASAPAPAEIVLRSGLGVDRISSRERRTVAPDPIEAQVVSGTWRRPAAGDSLRSPRGEEVTWQVVEANTNGWFEGPAARGGYIVLTHVADRDAVMVLQAAGHNMVYANGEPRAGDVYANGYVQLPVALHAGTNEFLFATGRGRLRASLSAPRAPQSLLSSDPTLPDLVTGSAGESWGAVVVMNATREWASGMELVAEVAGKRRVTRVPPLMPSSVRKMGFRMAAPALKAAGDTPLKLSLRQRAGRKVLDVENGLKLRVREPGQAQKITFVSRIDGSVQYYAANPGANPSAPGDRPALFLTLHGAGVEAIGQAEAYAPKRWGVLVAPTNRRPYGFDWEEWGRLDALEVLDLACQRFAADPARVYLTGHSMGGHGTWNLGANFPDRFAAVGPSAGWISFWSYAGSRRSADPDAIERMLLRGMACADTLGLSTNFSQLGVYILHGDADDNVPVTQARTMREHLEKFHRDLDWHEQPGAGHWWDDSDEAGTGCVDWSPMFDNFARHRRPPPSEVRRLQLTTMNPGVCAVNGWVTIAQQQRALEASRVDLRFDPVTRRFTGTTENVATLGFEWPWGAPAGPAVLRIDGQSLTNAWPEGQARAWLRRGPSGWSPGLAPTAAEKGPHRAGPFKEAFQHRMVFVFGTQGTPEENAWAQAKARFDAEQFWYRGNGSVDVIPDHEFRPAAFPDRGVVLYGNRDINQAWAGLLGASPVQVGRSEIALGGRRFAGSGLACLFVQPRADSERASVAVVAGTGPAGLRLTNRLPYFTAGTGYPDCLVLGPAALEQGNEGILAAGFFGNDWSVDHGQFEFRE